MRCFLQAVMLFLLSSVGVHATPFFPFDASSLRSYLSPEGVEVARFQRETENSWKEEVRREENNSLLEATWFSTSEEGILLHRTMRFDPQATVTVEFSEPVLFLPDNFPRRRKWAGRAPHSTMLVEMNLRSTPIRARIRMTYTYQFVVGEKETVGPWTAIPVTETALIEVASVEPDTGNPQLDAMLRQLLAQPGFLPYQSGSVLKWSATRWFVQDVGEVKTEEVAVAPNGTSKTRVRTLIAPEPASRP